MRNLRNQHEGAHGLILNEVQSSIIYRDSGDPSIPSLCSHPRETF